MGTFQTKKVWHSRLKGASPVIVKFSTGNIVESQYDDGLNIYFNVRGDDEDYYYQTENQAIRDYLERNVERNVWYSLTAAGQAEEATIALSPVDESSLPPTASPAPRQSSGGSYKAPQARSYSTGTVAGDMEKCVLAAANILEGMADMGLDASEENRLEFIEKLGVSLFIQWSRINMDTPLTADDVEEEEEAAEEEDVNEHIADLKSLYEELPLKSGTSHDNKKLKSVLDKISETIDAGEVEPEEGNAMISWLSDELAYQTADNGEEDLPF